MEARCRKQSVSLAASHAFAPNHSLDQGHPQKYSRTNSKLCEKLFLEDTGHFGNYKQRALNCNNFLKDTLIRKFLWHFRHPKSKVITS